MSVIFYGICGQGLGHCSRSLALIEHMPEHEIHIFTYGDAYDFYYSLNYPYLHRIHGLFFAQNTDGRVNTPKTFLDFLHYKKHALSHNINLIKDFVRLYKPDLYLTDWEPAIPRASYGTQKPLVSINSQHAFKFCNLNIRLPFYLRLYKLLVSCIADWYVPRADHYIISTFYADLLTNKALRGISINPCLIRKHLDNLPVSDENFLLVYGKHGIADIFANYLKDIDYEVRIYGADNPIDYPNLHYCNIDYINFITDLSKCRAILTTAGIQLLAEARKFGKRCLVVPLPNQHEQIINGMYVEKMGLGKCCSIKKLSSKLISEFIDDNSFDITPAENGIFQAARIINRILKNGS